MERSTLQDRIKLTAAKVDVHVGSFASAVESGLTARRKSLPCRHFYDREGSLLFEAICDLPEYYLTRTEREILIERVGELVALLPESVTLVELGSGSSVKTRILIDALLREEKVLRYVPIDISRSAVEQSSLDLVESYETLKIDAFVGEYADGLRQLGRDGSDRRLVLWLGSSIGNLDRGEAAAFLQTVRSSLGPRDHLLVGIDLRKAREVLEKAYDDPAGVTARFNRNLLVRINRELGGHFDLNAFRHRAFYAEEVGRVEMSLVSGTSQMVKIDRLEVEVPFESGEAIHTEHCYKYSLKEIETLAEAGGMRLARRWLDSQGQFSINLLALD